MRTIFWRLLFVYIVAISGYSAADDSLTGRTKQDFPAISNSRFSSSAGGGQLRTSEQAKGGSGSNSRFSQLPRSNSHFENDNPLLQMTQLHESLIASVELNIKLREQFSAMQDTLDNLKAQLKEHFLQIERNEKNIETETNERKESIREINQTFNKDLEDEKEERTKINNQLERLEEKASK